MPESYNIFYRAAYGRNNPKTPWGYDVYIHDLAVDEILERITNHRRPRGQRMKGIIAK